MQNNIKPLIINFTGKLGVYSPRDSIFEYFSFLEGDYNPAGDVIEGSGGNGGSDAGKSIWCKLLEFFGSGCKECSGYGGNIKHSGSNGKGSGYGGGRGFNGGSFFGGGNGPLIGGGNPYTGGSSSNNGTSGGVGNFNPPICENQSAFWAQYDFLIKKSYIKALSIVTTAYNIKPCTDPYTSNQPCDMSYAEILCSVATLHCISNSATQNDLVECLTTALASLNASPISIACEAAVEMFNITYGTNFSGADLSTMIGGFGNTCGNQEKFNEFVAEVTKYILPIYNWYFENVDGGTEYSIGDFDWSKHSPVAAQSLPTFAAYNNVYPQNSDGSLLTGAANIFGLLNGPINQIFVDYPGIHNVCALKVSIALNGAGVNIPHIWSDNNSNGIKDSSEQDFTIADNDGNYYFLNAELLISYLLEVFPAPTETVNGSDLNNGATPQSSFGSDQGIYGMLPVDPSSFGASGHCDIWWYNSNK